MKTARYFAIAISVLLAAACQKAMEKPEVEAGFAAKGALPEVTIDLTNYTIEEAKGSATVTATFSNVPEVDSVELGFLVSTSPDMSSANAVILEETTDGTYTAAVKVKTGTVNYVVATAATLDGSVYSETLELDVPSVPWYNMVAASYAADLHSYFEESDCEYPGHVIDVDLDVETKTITLTNLDAWAASQDVPTTLTGTIDLDTRVATFDATAQFVDHGIAAYGYYMVVLDPAVFDAEVGLLPNFEVTFSEDGSQMLMPLWGTVNSSGQFADIYLPATYIAVAE